MTEKAIAIEKGFIELLAHLHRGGGAGYWWTLANRASSWWIVDPRSVPLPGDTNVYFGVNPCKAIPQRKDEKTGRPLPIEQERGKLEDIAAINCLFADFDAKGFGGEMAKTLAIVNAVKPAPSVVICSGGGYHGYWLLREPFILATDEDRQRAQWLQEAFVKYVGADDGAKDLARVLRVPGTLNAKYIPPRRVTIERLDLQRLYELDDFRAVKQPAPGINLRKSGTLAMNLGASIREGAHGLDEVPRLLKSVLKYETWRKRIIEQTGQTIEFERFEDFVTTPPLEGLGIDIETIRRVCADDAETLDLLDKALQSEPGNRGKASSSKKARPAQGAPHNGGGHKAYASTALESEVQKVRGANEGERNTQLNKSALALGQLVAAGELTEAQVIDELAAAAQSAGLEGGEIARTIRSGLDKGKSEPRVIPELSAGVAMARAGHAEEGHGFDLTDIGNGKRLADRGKDKLRYIKEWGWLCWDGKRWQLDQTGAVERMAKETALSIFDETELLTMEERQASKELRTAGGAEDAAAAKQATDKIDQAQARMKEVRRWALQSQAYVRRLAMVADASSERPMVARPDWFDKDPMLLNCKNGTLDLRTGKLEPHAQAYHITHLVPFDYDPDAGCPTWTAFLDRVFVGDKDLISFIRRAMGYSLTGRDDEQCLFFLYGMGNNGKTKFANVLEELLGDYAKKTRAETLLTKHNTDSVPNDVAALAGARLVITAELPEGRRLNEGLAKDLTGTDTMSARFLHKEFFSFKTQFKLWMYGNHKPTIRGTDEGIWRRIRLVPFDVVIPKAERDPHIGDKLHAEMPGILAWTMAGCLAWQGQGLGAAVRVDEATAKYRAEQDELGAFINDCCVLLPSAKVRASALYEAYSKWCGSRPSLSAREFGIQLGERDFTRDRGTGGARIWGGLGLRPDEGE